jgi:hypothetical protein
MQYLTLHELARQFNKPERQVRYRFRELLKAGKLTEGEDFRKEDFVDEFHFAYKINPLRFIESYKEQMDVQADLNCRSIGELLKMKDQVLQLRGAREENSEPRSAWPTPRENAADEKPQPGEGSTQADAQVND